MAAAAPRALAAAALLALAGRAGAAAPASSASSVQGLAADELCPSGSSSCGLGLLQHASAGARGRRQAAEEAAPATMRACVQGAGGLAVKDVPYPTPTGNFALVKVEGSSVNPLDWKFAMPGVAGRDFAGTVVDVGGSCGVQVGDEVWGDATGAWAEYIAVDCDLVAARPSKVSAAEAGAMPHAAVTALQAWTAAGAPWSNSPTVVVLGGSGGVGLFAIQLAKAYGAGKIVTTCSPANFELVKSLGADETVDYHTADWWETLGANSADVVLDAVGEAGTGDRAAVVLRDGGSFLTLLGGPALASAPRAGTRQQWFRMHTGGISKDLDSLKELVDEGKVTVHIGATYPLERAAEAVAASKAGHSVGKIAISVP